MGWLWDTPPPTSKPSQPQPTSSPPSHPPLSTPTPATSDPPPANPPPPQPPSRDDLAEAELRAFLQSLDFSPTSSPQVPPHPSHHLPNTTTTPIPPTKPAHPSQNPHLYPPTISCRAAFDTAFYCQSLGGQFTSLYRYGRMRDCREQWSHFWFCMRTNRGSMGEGEREERVRRHYWAREGKYREGASSEDVWAERKWGEGVEGAFAGVVEERVRDGG